MVGGCAAHKHAPQCLYKSCDSLHRLPRACPALGLHQRQRSNNAVFQRQPLTARVAQQLGETVAEVVPQPQQELSSDLLAAVAEEVPVEVPSDVLTEFEHELEGDLSAVAVTLTAVTGVIIFWRGVWSLLDFLLGDSIFGDICCIIVGLTIVLGIRLSGVKVSSSLWPPS